MRKVGLLIAIALIASGAMQAQVISRPERPLRTSEALTLDDLVSAAKYYFRDSAELPMLQQTTVSFTEASGKARKPQVQSVDYLFHGYSRQNKTGNVTTHGHESMWAALRGSRTFKAAINSGFIAVMPGILLYSDTSKFNFETGPSGKAGAKPAAKLSPRDGCPPFEMKQNKDEYLPDGLCGTSNFQLDDDLRLEKFTFEAANLPAEIDVAPFGKCTLTRYHAEVEFQAATVAGDKDPFQVPKLVTTTLETSKGRVVISSNYRPKPQGKL